MLSGSGEWGFWPAWFAALAALSSAATSGCMSPPTVTVDAGEATDASATPHDGGSSSACPSDRAAAASRYVGQYLEAQRTVAPDFVVEPLIEELRGPPPGVELAVVWARFTEGGVARWGLGQLFCRRADPRGWRWYVVTDGRWRHFTIHDRPPGNAEVLDFLSHWDFEPMGRNGPLIEGQVHVETWRRLIGEAPPVSYP